MSDDGRSIASSFSRLTDDSRSVTPTSTFEESLSALALSEKEHEEQAILRAIVGRWNITSSVNMEEYLEARRTHLKVDDIDDIVFELGQPSFDFDGTYLTRCIFVGSKKYSDIKAQLGVPNCSNTYTQTTVIEENCMITIYFNQADGEEYSREKRYVKDGRLHMIHTRFGITCTRIYEKTTGALTKDNANSNRMDVEELKKERATCSVLDHRNLQRKIDHLEVVNKELNTKVRELQLIEEPERIENAIAGFWRIVQGNRDDFVRSQRGRYPPYIVISPYEYKKSCNTLSHDFLFKLNLNMKTPFDYSFSNCVTFVSDNKILTVDFCEWQQNLIFRIERSIVNGHLYLDDYINGNLVYQRVYERCDPDEY
ncbi:unnamed protein product [Caenorhabditis sp. 36 PRJEB53466]|nr:unnamed protein product [Caenorhabditis sp. 36 PRJEB53466]